MLPVKDIVDAFSLKNVTVRGDELTCSCPIPENHRHGDQNPSFGINLLTGACNCFGCHYHGNLFTMAVDILGMTPMEASRLVDGDLGTGEVEQLINGRPRGIVNAKGRVGDFSSAVSTWAMNRHPYWASRGFTDATVGHWMLGYDPSNDRVVVPVRFGGRFVGWSKRRVREDVEPKWVHSKGFDRAGTLFGLDECSGDSCVLVEAPLSAIMLWQQGIPNAVASFGCQLSERQALLIRQRFESVTTFYDPDEAGAKGTERAIKMLAPFVDLRSVRGARDDPAAQSIEENVRAIDSAKSWCIADYVV